MLLTVGWKQYHITHTLLEVRDIALIPTCNTGGQLTPCSGHPKTPPPLMFGQFSVTVIKQYCHVVTYSLVLRVSRHHSQACVNSLPVLPSPNI